MSLLLGMFFYFPFQLEQDSNLTRTVKNSVRMCVSAKLQERRFKGYMKRQITNFMKQCAEIYNQQPLQ